MRVNSVFAKPAAILFAASVITLGITGTTAAQKTLVFNLRRLRVRIEEASGGPLGAAGREKIAHELGVELAEVESMELRLAAADQSLNAPISESSEDDLQGLLADHRPSPEEVVIGLRDSATRSRWLDDALFRPEVRDAYRRLVDQGWTDALRKLHPGERIYTFWDYFRNAYGRAAGLRIDHLLLSPAVDSRLEAAGVDRAYRGREKASDHAPTWIVLRD